MNSSKIQYAGLTSINRNDDEDPDGYEVQLTEPRPEDQPKTDASVNNQGEIYDEEKKWIGYVCQMTFVILQCLNQFFGKVLFVRHPDEVNISQLIVIRSIGALIVLFMIMNKKSYQYLFQNVPRHLYRKLVTRCLLGVLSIVTLYTCIRYFPLVLVSLISNIAPLLVALLSWFFFKVKLTRLNLAVLFISFAGVILLILSSGETFVSSVQNNDKS